MPACRAASDGAGPFSQSKPPQGTCSTSGAVANLAATAIGAGMLALPKAVSTVGVLVAAALFLLAAALTHFSAAVIVRRAACCSSFSCRGGGQAFVYSHPPIRPPTIPPAARLQVRQPTGGVQLQPTDPRGVWHCRCHGATSRNHHARVWCAAWMIGLCSLLRDGATESGAASHPGAISICNAGVQIVYNILLGDMLVGSAPDFAGVIPTWLGRHEGTGLVSREFVVG